MKFTQYVLTTKPEIPADSADVLRHLVRSLPKDTKEALGLINFKGNIIYGTKSVMEPQIVKSTFNHNEIEHEFAVEINKTKE